MRAPRAESGRAPLRCIAREGTRYVEWRTTELLALMRDDDNLATALRAYFARAAADDERAVPIDAPWRGAVANRGGAAGVGRDGGK